MTTAVENEGQALAAKLLASDNLPTLPVVALKVLELTQQPDVSVSELAVVVQGDPALTARVLKLANSSLFGMPKKVSSIQQAVVILGLRTMKVLVLSFSLLECLGQGKDQTFDYEKYWYRSLTMAVAAKLLAEAVGNPRRDEAFVGGLLADLGLMAAQRCVPTEYAPVLTAYGRGGQAFQNIENEILGTNHAHLTRSLLSHWCLPEVLCQTVGAHHGDDLDQLDEPTRGLAAILWAAAMIADLFCGDKASTDLEHVKLRCVELAGISRGELETLLETMNEKVAEVASLFAVEIGEPQTYEQLQLQAAARLATMSLDAELQRVEAARRADDTQQELVQLSGETRALQAQVCTDALTGIGNRQAFDDGLHNLVAQARAASSSVGLILIDLDRFKNINDQHGHQAGDEVLRAVGRCLAKLADGPVQVARYGGEEFAVMVADPTAQDIRRLAEDIRKSIRRTRIPYKGKTLRVTVSCGVAHVHFAYEQPAASEIVERADECLYSAKHAGRDCVEISF